MSDHTITVKYHTLKSRCTCCNQKLPVAETINKEIVIDKETAYCWTDWDDVDPEDVESMVPDFVYDTISFYASNLFEDFTVEDGELERVKEFFLREIVTPS